MYRIPSNVDWSFVVGQKLMQICVGPFDIQLHFTGQVRISIHGENPKESFCHKTGLLSSSAVQGLPGAAVSLVSLLGATVERVLAEDSTTLAVYFSNREELRIYDCSDHYESFSVDGPGGLIVV